MTDHVDPALVERLLEARGAVEERIARAGAARDRVKILAVSKGRPESMVRAAIEAGFDEFGENFAAELAAKAVEFAGKPTWHFIGQLQTNKVRVVAPFVAVYQSVDRGSLVVELAKRAPGARVLVQVNLAGVPGRGGASWEDAPELTERCRAAGLRPEGFMGVAPVDDPRAAAASFRRLRGLCDAERLAECSMGMSDDLEIAIAEGSTMVRIGSAIFGRRA